MLKEHILNYKELNPDILYYDLVKIFGLPLKELFKLLNINNYKIKNKYINFYDTNGNRIYYEDSYGYRNKWEYDVNGNLIY